MHNWTIMHHYWWRPAQLTSLESVPFGLGDSLLLTLLYFTQIRLLRGKSAMYSELVS